MDACIVVLVSGVRFQVDVREIEKMVVRTARDTIGNNHRALQQHHQEHKFDKIDNYDRWLINPPFCSRI